MAKMPSEKTSAPDTAGLEERIRQLEQERDAALARLRQAEDARWTLEAVMDHIPEGITIADAPGVRIRLVSRYGQELTGRPLEEITCIDLPEIAKVWEIFHPDGTPAKSEELPLTRATLSGEVVRNEEWILRRPDGGEVTVLVNAGPIRNGEGRITGGVVAWRDINQLRLTMRTLRTVTEYRLALDSARLGTWEYDFLSARFLLGERCRSFFGTLEQGIEYERFLALFHPEDRPDLERAIEQASSDLDGHFTLELRVARPDGSLDWLLIHAQAIFTGIGESHRAVRLIGTVMDITERKKAEEALRESEERFRGTFENAAVGIAHVDLEGRFMRVNRRLCDILGYPCPELVQKTFMELTHDEDLKGDLALAEQLLRGEIDSYTREKRYFQKNGQTVHCFLTVSLQRSEQGKPLHYISVVEDITPRKEAEAALRESQERLDLALKAVRGGVWQLSISPEAPDEISDHVYISPKLKEVIGFGAEEFPDSLAAWQELIHPDDLPTVRQATRRCLTGATPDYQVEYRIRHRDGSWRWLLSLGRMLRDPQGRPVRWAGVDLNITEQKKMEQELRLAIHRCGEDSRAKDEFMANISHELRTPMTIIMTSLQLLQQDDVPQRNYLLEVSDAAAHQLLEIIDELLDFSLLEKQEMEIRRKPFNVRNCVQKAVNAVAGQASEKNLRLEVEIAPNVPETVIGDAKRLGQVLFNLIDNAVKFTDTGGVQVQAGIDGPALVFSVRDTGIGIPEEKMPLLFEKFTQGDTSSTRRYSGTGLGLAISRGLVELMGGRIWAESREGKGSVFSFTFPLGSGSCERDL